MPIAQDGKTGILLAAFGSSDRPGHEALQGFTDQVRATFPGVPVRWAFTSGRMRTRLAKAGKKTDSVKKALCRMGFEKFSHVAVQSLHLIPGIEYESMLEEGAAAKAEGGPRHITVGLPLLHEPDDVRLAAQALLDHLPVERQPEECVVCMGHGTWHSGEASYASLSKAVTQADPRIFIGTLDGKHSITHLLPDVRSAADASCNATVWLLPLLSVIGKHAREDMAGSGKNSWRSLLESAGLRCIPVLTGTVEYTGFTNIWLSHLKTAMKQLRQ